MERAVPGMYCRCMNQPCPVYGCVYQRVVDPVYGIPCDVPRVVSDCSPSYSIAFREGFGAFNRGCSVFSNPYENRHHGCAKEWRAGYMAAGDQRAAPKCGKY